MMEAGQHPTVLEARTLTKRYSVFTAVRDASFSAAAGRILGILGPNGAGKSTIVKMITGLVRPTQGAILFHQDPIHDDLTGFKRALGYVPEQPELYGFLTGWEYLEMVANLRGLERHLFRARASAMLEGFTLYSSRDLPIGSYSKGMRQRIVVISALLHDPELLVLDEPFSGLDVTSSLVFRKVIALLAEQGKAVLFSSPVLEQAERLCSDLVVLKEGFVVASGSVQEVSAKFTGLDLEAGFMQLTEQVDTDHVARNIVAACGAPAR